MTRPRGVNELRRELTKLRKALRVAERYDLRDTSEALARKVDELTLLLEVLTTRPTKGGGEDDK